MKRYKVLKVEYKDQKQSNYDYIVVIDNWKGDINIEKFKMSYVSAFETKEEAIQHIEDYWYFPIGVRVDDDDLKYHECIVSICPIERENSNVEVCNH